MDRLKIFQVVIYIVAVTIILRLFYWQFFAKINSSAQELNQDETPAPRGEIYTSDNFPIVANQEAFLIYGKPNEIKNPQEVAKVLSPYLVGDKFARPPATEATGFIGQATREGQLTDDEKEQKEEEIRKKEEEIISKLSNRNLLWVQLARKAPKAVREKVDHSNINAIGFESDEKRFYPESSMAAQLLGFVASDKFGQDTGYFGLEGYWDRKLRGKTGRLGQEQDPFGFPILVGKFRPLTPKKGASLYLALDRTIQFMVQEKLQKAVNKFGAKEGTVIVANPENGQILAMATYPAYDPAQRAQFDEKLYLNPAVADTYEPGSTFKLITVAAALDLALVDPASKCNICTGPRQIGGFEISTWNKKYYPNSTVSEIIQHSDNIGMTFVADKLGLERLYDYIIKFGFGKPTGVDLQEEAAGSIRDKNQWRPIDLATASFGQGIAVTPIQMVQAVSAIANSGKLTTPKVVKFIKTEDKVETVKPETERQVISKRTASLVTEMMVNAVENGEARAFAPKGYRIAGKTGTAQIPVSGHYDPNKTIASFVGFAPADDPKFVMLVRFSEPSSSPFGSETAAPTFFDIAKELFNYFEVLPTS